MTPTKSTIYILIIFGILGVILLSYFLLKGDDDLLNKNNESSKETDHSVYPGVDIITEITDEMTHNIAIHYPKFYDQTLNKKISEYVMKSEKEFISEVKKNTEFLKEYPATLYIFLISIELLKILIPLSSIRKVLFPEQMGFKVQKCF